MSGQTALSAVATAVYGALAGDAALTAILTGGVWDHPPKDPTFPLAQLSGFNETQHDTAGLQCRAVDGEIQILSTYEGMDEIYRALDRIVALLRYEEPALAAGWVWDAILYVGGAPLDSELLEDNVLLQGLSASFQFIVQEAP